MMQNLNNPLLQPDLPNYPLLEQFVRATAPTIGSNIYPGIVQQWSGVGAAFRDREPCYMTEPNGVVLAPAIYDCRLVGSYLGLPLYATSCCVSGGFSSSLSSAG